MSVIPVTINFSYYNITNGRITVTPLETFVNQDNDIIVGNIPYQSFPISGGDAVVTIYSTQDVGVGNEFVIESGIDPNYTEVDRFVAVIDNTTPQDGKNLVTGFFSKDLLDTSVWSIADLLSQTPFLDRIAARIPGFNYKPWTTTETFLSNEFTFRGGRLYQWIKSTSGTNVDPLTTGNYTDPGNLLDGTIDANAGWLVMTGSLIGSGTTTSDVDYDKDAFAALATEPASRENLAQLDTLLRSLLTPDLTDYARKTQTNTYTATNVFSADITVPDQLATDESSKAANTRTVKAIVNNVSAFANLTGRTSIVEERKNVGVASSLVNGVNVRQLNTIHLNSGDIVSLNSSVVTIKAGTYLVYATAVTNKAGGSKLFIYNEATGDNYSTRSSTAYTNTYDTNNIESTLLDVLTFATQVTLSLRQIVEFGGSTSGGFAANRSGYSELFSRIIFFKLA